MAVKIIIERTVHPSRQQETAQLLRELRAKAILQPGYICGETLFSVEEPGAHAVISTWDTLENWRAWESSPQRRQLAARLEPLLRSPEKARAFVESSAPPTDPEWSKP